jgi:outer membrane protein TolC
MRAGLGRVVLAAILLVPAAPAGAQSAGAGPALSLDQALKLAVEGSRLVAASRAQAQASREMEVSAGQLPDPVLKAGLDNVPLSGPDQFSVGRDFMTQRSIGLMQEFAREDKRRARAARYEREAQVGEARRELTVAQVRRDVSSAWLERSYQESARSLLQAQAAEAELQVDAADSAYRAGRGSQADVFAARTQLEQIHDRASAAEQQIAAATAQLSRWIGAEADRPLAERPATDAAPPAGALVDDQLDRHPQLAVLAGQEAMAQADADLARANRRPDWSWELTYSQRGSSYSNMISLNVSVPVPWNRSHLQDRELAARLAQRDQAQAEREDARRALAAEAQAAWRQWSIQRARLARYDASLTPLAERRTEAALAAYRAAAAPLSTVLEARRGEIETKLDRLNVELEAARLWVQLNYLTAAAGGDLPAAR